MQTLQCLAQTLQEPSTLQRLRNNLQELPWRLLARLDAQEDFHYGHVTGEFNFHFTFRLEGGGYFQTGVLVASAERAPGGLPVPLQCRWKRRVDDMTVEIPGVTSNMYQISADDVGTDVFVEAAPADADDGLFGVAVGQIGPFELDPATRRSLDNALSTGGERFAVTQSRENSSATLPKSRQGPGQELSVNVSADGVRVANTQGSGGREIVAEYSFDFPKVVIHPLDTTKFQLVMSETRTFYLAARSRTSRDLIALTIRCFHAKRHISTTAILKELLPVQPLVPGFGAPPPGPPDSRLYTCIVLERQVKELNRTMQQREVSERCLRNTNMEKRQLQAQLLETIGGFTEVIEELQDQLADGSAHASAPPPVDAQRLQEQLRESSSQNQALQGELRGLRQELERLIAGRQAGQGLGAGVLEREACQLREERSLLQARLQDLCSLQRAAAAGAPEASAAHPASSSSSSARAQPSADCSEQAHLQELKRLRQDVEELHYQKERLRHELQEKDREREELQQNFLYVKGQMDKVQMKQMHSASSSSGDGYREVERHEKRLDTAGEERSRLSMRLESFLRDAEKEKAYHEQSLERVMTANARLMEEKDRASREVQRLSQLYAESVKQVQSETDRTHVSGMFGSDSFSDSGAIAAQEEIAKVRAELAAVEEGLRRREEENESLKSRIRKLAVA